MTTALVCLLFTAALLFYVFAPERDLAAQTPKSRLEFLQERKDVLYENLRDLNFEYRAGKLPEDEYLQGRDELEGEASAVLGEIERLSSPNPR